MVKTGHFINKLYILCNTNDVIHKKSISWNNDNTSFIISNIDYFQKNILSKYFKHNNYSSFVRQLNMYNFSRKTSGNIVSNFKECFTHKFFTRDNQLDLHKISRKQIYKRKRQEDEVPKKEKKLNILEEKFNLLEKENIVLKNKIKKIEEHLIIFSKLLNSKSKDSYSSCMDYLYKDPNIIDNICDTTWIPS